jgi:hypothetical protein
MSQIDKKYQVFVSSTYEDLIEERREVMQTLLELNCIPSGMELFPATNKDQWALIQGVISDCDYYIAIIGGCYGSIGPDGISYTEMEYRYALNIGKPTIAFIHSNIDKIPYAKVERNSNKKKKLQLFCNLVREKMVRFWDSPKGLALEVSKSLKSLTESNPGIGWIRANKGLSHEADGEMQRMKNEIKRLNLELSKISTIASESVVELAQGDDIISLNYTYFYNDLRYEERKKRLYYSNLELSI